MSDKQFAVKEIRLLLQKRPETLEKTEMFSSSTTQENFNEKIDEIWNREPDRFHYPFIRLQTGTGETDKSQGYFLERIHKSTRREVSCLGFTGGASECPEGRVLHRASSY
ncbi:hypothetical protein CEXT_325071 [Caerostris extrusa]|uniref:Uncharacterized protein n=1 Tax=Caerostris extrusa TaxID=172846 RepID=A0AAV4PUC8_CAEEX|nr:hypothetical protein CEXT_325071 [Caerostris extrusa]